MKKHVKHLAAGGVAVPTALAGAVTIANEIQTVLGLHLQGVGLAVFLSAFILGASAVMFGQLRLEAQRILAEIGNGELDLGQLLGSLGSLFPQPSPATSGDASTPAAATPAPSAVIPPPPSPPGPRDSFPSPPLS